MLKSGHQHPRLRYLNLGWSQHRQTRSGFINYLLRILLLTNFYYIIYFIIFILFLILIFIFINLLNLSFYFKMLLYYFFILKRYARLLIISIFSQIISTFLKIKFLYFYYLTLIHLSISYTILNNSKTPHYHFHQKLFYFILKSLYINYIFISICHVLIIFHINLFHFY